jgi:hypothetical protein
MLEQLVESRMPLQGLVLPNKVGKQVAVPRLPLMCVLRMVQRSTVQDAYVTRCVERPALHHTSTALQSACCAVRTWSRMCLDCRGGLMQSHTDPRLLLLCDAGRLFFCCC